MISYSSRICFFCKIIPSVFFCQEGHNYICTILAVKKFESSGGHLHPPPPLPLPTLDLCSHCIKQYQRIKAKTLILLQTLFFLPHIGPEGGGGPRGRYPLNFQIFSLLIQYIYHYTLPDKRRHQVQLCTKNRFNCYRKSCGRPT